MHANTTNDMKTARASAIAGSEAWTGIAITVMTGMIIMTGMTMSGESGKNIVNRSAIAGNAQVEVIVQPAGNAPGTAGAQALSG